MSEKGTKGTKGEKGGPSSSSSSFPMGIGTLRTRPRFSPPWRVEDEDEDEGGDEGARSQSCPVVVPRRRAPIPAGQGAAQANREAGVPFGGGELTTKDTKVTKVGQAFLPVHRVGGLNRQDARAKF